MKKQTVFVQIVLVLALIVSATAIVTAAGPDRIRNSADSQPPEPLTTELPPLAKGPMTTTPAVDAVSVLSFDDGSCEGGLGAGVLVTDFVDWDVPTQCIQSGLQVIGVTGKVNSGSATMFAFGQAGATPPAAGAGSLIGMTANILATGPCPGTALTSRTLNSSAVITSTTNFFAGLQSPTGFLGRDTNGPAAGRIWLNCATCGMTQYTPTDLTGLGLGGNWMIRVTVEDANCVPVELMDFNISG